MAKLGNLADAVGGRLTLESGVPVSSTDQSAKATLYYTPYLHDQISLYNGADWVNFTFTEKSISLAALDDASNYDIWMYDNAGTLTLEALKWTSGTARATALVQQNGRYCKTGVLTRRYLGTIRTSAAGQCSDTLAKRFVWNMYNRVNRPLSVSDATASWTYATATWREARGQTTNLLQIVVGMAGISVEIQLMCYMATSAVGYAFVGIGKNSITAADVYSGVNNADATTCTIPVFFTEPAPLGYTYYAWLEYSKGSSTTTFSGPSQSGMTGRLMG